MKHTWGAGVIAAMILVAGSLFAHEETGSRAHYLGNEGVMVEHGDTKIVFDPLFSRDYVQYQLVPGNIKSALMAGKPPWDGIDAVFVSHYHEDHFDPAQMLTYLQTQSDIHFYAPEQAVAGLRQLADGPDDGLFDRVHAIALDYGDAPVTLIHDGLLIEAVRIPHAGWPESRTEVANIVFRVTLDGATTVSHLGDADADVVHFDEDYWRARPSHLALPPYWFLSSSERRLTLVPLLHADRSVGIHVPKNIPGEPGRRPAELREVDLFTRPGETREISGTTTKPH